MWRYAKEFKGSDDGAVIDKIVHAKDYCGLMNHLKLREQVMEAIEPLRREKVIRSGLEAEVTVPASAVPEGFSADDLATLFITGTVTLGDGDSVSVAKSGDAKCGRCWRLLPEVSEDGDLCQRCEDVVAEMDASA